MKRKEPREMTRYEAFVEMDAVITTLIPRDPPSAHLRTLPDALLLGYASALDGHLEEIQREWIKRQMARE